MAMIGRGAAIAEVGKHHHEVHGQLAHMAWLGVHASLMTGNRDKIEAIVDWGWDRFSKTGGPHVLDRGDAAKIDWDDDPTVTSSGADRGAAGSGASVRRRSMIAVASTAVDLSRAPVRDHVDLPLPVRPADARARAAGGDHADDLASHA